MDIYRKPTEPPTIICFFMMQEQPLKWSQHCFGQRGSSLPSVPVVVTRASQNFPRPGSVGRADDTLLLHNLNHPRRTVIAYPKTTLHHGNRGLPRLRHHRHRLIVFLVILFTAAFNTLSIFLNVDCTTDSSYSAEPCSFRKATSRSVSCSEI